MDFEYKLWLLVGDLVVWQPGNNFVAFAVTTTSVLELLVTDVL